MVFNVTIDNNKGTNFMDNRNFLNDKHFLLFLDNLCALRSTLDNPSDVRALKRVVNRTYNYFHKLLSQ